MKKIRVLVVDDSAVVRQSLTAILESHRGIEVIATAADPFIAAQKIAAEVPDVITLDIEMPRMDGITFLKKIMSQHPIPVVIISSLTAKGTETAIHALEIGAVDVIKKPALNVNDVAAAEQHIIEVVKAASKSVVTRKKALRAEEIVKPPQIHSMIRTTERIIAVGASTGGTEAILQFLQMMPIDCPGIVIVQHMPEMFTKSFADRLNRICKITVKEASAGDTILRGQALIAPGNHHLVVRRSGARYFVDVIDAAPENRHRPSVDVLFNSAAKYAGRNACGIILTGMGADGAKGLLEMKKSGAYTIAQDENTCIVFGMPKEAIKLNAVEKILPLPQIAPFVLNQTKQ